MQYWPEHLNISFTVLNWLCIQVIQRQIAQHIKKSRITASSVIMLRAKRTGCFTLTYTKKLYQEYEAEKVTECLCFIQMYILEMYKNILLSTYKNHSLSKSTFHQMRSHTTPNHYEPQLQKREYTRTHINFKQFKTT